MASGVEVVGLKELIRTLQPDLVADPARAMLSAAEDVMVGSARDAGVGSLSRSVKGQVDPRGVVPMWSKAFTKDFRAKFVEEGTDPHFPPPDVFSTPGMGFAIAVSIARKGTTKRPFMKPALAKAQSQRGHLVRKLFHDLERKFYS